MVTTFIAFIEEDTVEVLTALEVKQMPKIWHLGELGVIERSGPAVLKVEALMAAGISFNYASYNVKDSLTPAKHGQVRYGHDGTEMHFNLVPNPELMHHYSKELLIRTGLDTNQRTRISHVCSGQDTWDNRKENGQMHKLRRLLT